MQEQCSRLRSLRSARSWRMPCLNRKPGTKAALPNGLITKLAASSGAAHGSIVGLWHVTYTTSDNELFQKSLDMWHSDGTELETANVNGNAA